MEDTFPKEDQQTAPKRVPMQMIRKKSAIGATNDFVVDSLTSLSGSASSTLHVVEKGAKALEKIMDELLLDLNAEYAMKLRQWTLKLMEEGYSAEDALKLLTEGIND